MKTLRLLTAALALSVACTPNERQAAHEALPAAERVSLPLTDTLWVRGGRPGDTLASYPEYLGHDANAVYVTDMAKNEVVALEATTGAIRWRSRSTQGELKAPASITGIGGGGVAAIDASGAVVRLDARGRVVSTTPLPDGELARQVCSLSDTTFLVAYLRQELPLVIIASSGRIVKRLELPWPGSRELSAMQTQLVLGGGDGACAAALAYGEGFALVRGDTVVWTTPYVEPVPMPRLKERTTADAGTSTIVEQVQSTHPVVRDVSIADGRVAVLFEGKTRTPGSNIDEYDLKSGAYVGTLVTGRRIVGLQLFGKNVIALAGLSGYPALIALRRPPVPAR